MFGKNTPFMNRRNLAAVAKVTGGVPKTGAAALALTLDVGGLTKLKFTFTHSVN